MDFSSFVISVSRNLKQKSVGVQFKISRNEILVLQNCLPPVQKNILVLLLFYILVYKMFHFHWTKIPLIIFFYLITRNFWYLISLDLFHRLWKHHVNDNVAMKQEQERGFCQCLCLSLKGYWRVLSLPYC